MQQAGSAASTPQLAEYGSTCAGGGDCESGLCVKGACCAEATCGTCERCGSDGRCQVVREDVEPYSCASPTSICDANGRCTKALGQSCSGFAGAECGSGICDGVCCAIRCGPCEHCADDGRSCVTVAFADDLDSCQQGKTCSGGRCANVDYTQIEQTDWLPASSGGRAGRVFTVQSSGELTELRVKVMHLGLPVCWGPARIERVASDGSPSGELVAMGVVSPERNGDATLRQTIALDPGLPVRAGDRLALVLDVNGSGGCSIGCASRDSSSGSERDSSWQYEDGNWLKFLCDIAIKVIVAGSA